jgi:hypothetical protein
MYPLSGIHTVSVRENYKEMHFTQDGYLPEKLGGP